MGAIKSDDDHNPLHFHVEYQGHQALMSIESGEILTGTLPTKQSS